MSSSPPSRWPGPGLRGRLILGFVAVAVLSCAATVVVAYLMLLYLFQSYGRFSITPSRTVSGHDLPNLAFALVLRFFPQHPSNTTVVLVLIATFVVLLAVIVLLAQLAARRVLRPMRQLVNAAQRLAHGDLRVRLTATGTDEMAELVRSFNEMASALQSKVVELSRMNAQAQRFAGDVSHELRTPLAAMVAVTDVLDEQADKFEGDAAAAARLVSRETGNLNRLVGDLIEISRFDAGSAGLVLDVVNLAAAVRDCLRVRGWTADVVVDPLPDLRLVLDPRRLDVIIANLVGNALRHGAAPVTVQAWVNQSSGWDWVSLRVSDRGSGLPAAVLPHVFERFYKADTARSRSEGSGLGLAIAWENARLHDGTIEAANAPDGGATFTLHLPVARTRPVETRTPSIMDEWPAGQGNVT